MLREFREFQEVVAERKPKCLHEPLITNIRVVYETGRSLPCAPLDESLNGGDTCFPRGESRIGGFFWPAN